METILRIIPAALKVCPHLPVMEHAVVAGYMFTSNDAFSYLISKAEINQFQSIIIDFTRELMEDGFCIAAYNISSLISLNNVYITIRLTPEQLTPFSEFSDSMNPANTYIQVVMSHKFPHNCNGELIPMQLYMCGKFEGDDTVIPIKQFMSPRYKVDPNQHHISKWITEAAEAAEAAHIANQDSEDEDASSDEEDKDDWNGGGDSTN